MKEINLFINEKLKINKNSSNTDYEKTYTIYVKSSIYDEKHYLERLTNKCKINTDNIEINEFEHVGYSYTYKITVYNKKDLLSLFIYIFDSYSEETIHLLDDVNILDKYLNRGIKNYNKEWKEFLHSNFNEDAIKDRVIEYIKDNY